MKLAIAVAIALISVACGNGSNPQQGMAIAYLEAIQAQNFDEARAIQCEPSRSPYPPVLEGYEFEAMDTPATTGDFEVKESRVIVSFSGKEETIRLTEWDSDNFFDYTIQSIDAINEMTSASNQALRNLGKDDEVTELEAYPERGAISQGDRCLDFMKIAP